MQDLNDQNFENNVRRDQWYIPTSNGFVPNDDGGFAANVFVKGNSNEDEKVLAIRGTETDFSFTPLNLLPVDLWPGDFYEVARYGLALHQPLGPWSKLSLYSAVAERLPLRCNFWQ